MENQAPVLFVIFNRPDLTEETFKQIRKAKVSVLYLAADGPRNEGERELCETARRIVLDNIDWDCTVHTLLRDENLGCKDGVVDAIDWFFEHEKQGIILEDDCVPNQSFFSFCSQMLWRYRDDKRIFHITGLNRQKGLVRGSGDYYFSYFPSIWGWATWKDRWEKYCVRIHDYKKTRRDVLNHFLRSKNQRYLYNKIFTSASSGEIDTWDHQWTYTLFKHKGLAIVPNVNLISNIGFGPAATHTKKLEKDRANQRTVEMNFPLKHPLHMEVNNDADDLIRNYIEKLGNYQRTKSSKKEKFKQFIIQSQLFPRTLKKILISDF